MNFNIQSKLVGVRPSAGSMKGDDGENITWDQIELHVLAPLDEARGGVGNTVQIHKIKGKGISQGVEADKLKQLVGRDIQLQFQMMADGKGGNPRNVLVGWAPVAQATQQQAAKAS